MQAWTVDQAAKFVEYIRSMDLDDFPPTVAAKIEGYVEGMQGTNFWLNDRSPSEACMGAVEGYLAGRDARRCLRQEAEERGELPDIDPDQLP